jgi:predicted amidophosphoribosyltransferase
MLEVWQTTAELRGAESPVLVPVPITRTHLLRRGYNQAEELAKALAKQLSIPVAQPLLRLTTGADSQTKLSSAQRLRNAMAAYALAPDYASGKRPLPAHLVLVDDVFTTGATARACAKALKEAPGVKSVAVLTALRAVLD